MRVLEQQETFPVLWTQKWRRGEVVFLKPRRAHLQVGGLYLSAALLPGPVGTCQVSIPPAWESRERCPCVPLDPRPSQEAAWQPGLQGTNRFRHPFRNPVLGESGAQTSLSLLGIVCSGAFLYFCCPLVRSGRELATWYAKFLLCIKAVLLLVSLIFGVKRKCTYPVC